jgi:subtilisin family serine protease
LQKCVYPNAPLIRAAHVAGSSAYRDEQAWIDEATTNGYYPGATLTIAKMTSGTSFSAAIVTGIVARLRQQYPELGVRGIWDKINGTLAQTMPQYPPNYTALPVNFGGDGVAANDKLIYIPYNE